MKTLRRSLFVFFLALGAASCGTSSITAPDCDPNVETCEHQPDTGNHQPGTGSHQPGTGSHQPGTGS